MPGRVELRLSGRPVPSKNSRVRAKGQPYMVTNKRASSWMDGAAAEARTQMRDLGLRPLAGPLRTHMTFHVRNLQHLGDGDNLVVTVHDALKKIVFEDDRPSIICGGGWEVVVDGTQPPGGEYVTVVLTPHTISGATE